MGAAIEDRDFYAIILGSLPESYRPLLSSINATARIAQKPLTPYELVNVISEEYEHRQLTDRRTPKKGSNTALTAKTGATKGRNPTGTTQANQDVTCFNCDRKGHYKADCWRPGGGKEGQGPQQKQKKGARSPKHAANSAKEPQGETQESYAFATSDLAGIAKGLKVPADRRGAIVDSGATSHFCPDRTKFVTFQSISPQQIYTADGSTLSAIGRGDVNIDLPLGDKRTTVVLKDALYAPKMAFTLISANRIAGAGLAVHFEDRLCRILSPGPQRKVVVEIPQVEGLYAVATQSKHHANVARTKLTVNELHRVLGHVSQTAVKHAVSLVDGLELDTESNPEFCDTCVKAKATRQTFPQESKNRAKTYGEVIHTDLWGPAQTTSLGGHSYYISFTDDFSRETKLTFLKQKSEALASYKQYEAWLGRQRAGAKVKTVRSDRGGEYLSSEFDKYLQDNGIERQLTVHDSPQSNGVAERLNRTLVEHARAMLLARDLPKFLWAEAVNYATWLKNRLPSHAIPGHTPFDLIHGRRPSLSEAHEFGSPAYVRLENTGKLEARAEEVVFVGVDEESKGYRVYWPAKRRVSVERNVSFAPISVSMADDVQDEGELGVPETNGVPDVLHPSSTPPSTPPRPSQTLPPTPPAPRSTRTRPQPGYYAALNRGEKAALAIEGTLEAAESDLVDEQAVELTSQLALAAVEPEPTLQQALNGPDAVEWQEAIDYEISQLEKLGAWEVVDRPAHANVIPCHYVLVTKRGPDGEKLKLRARLVANGQRQQHGLDYSDTFAPTSNMSTIRTVLSMAASQDWEIHQVDIKSAYLHAEIKEDIYMRAPPGYLKTGDEGKVLKLLRCLYGLKQAGFEWSEELASVFLQLGFRRSQVDQAVYFKRSQDEHMVVTVSVDDMAVTSNHLRHILAFKDRLRDFFEISDLGELTWLLGLKVNRDRAACTITLTQKAYTETILERFRLSEAKAATTPMDPGAVFSVDQSAATLAEYEEMRDIPYQRAVGSLMYAATSTRPDISFSVATLSQFMRNPGSTHWEAAKRVLRYLKGTSDYGITLGTTDGGLEAYVDADWASQAHRHSMSGYVVLLNGGPVAWSARKQPLIALSTAEAEYIALTTVAREVLYLQLLVGELYEPVTLPTPVYCDNQAAIALASNNKFHSRTKHIDLRYHFVRDHVKNGTFGLHYCPTDDNVADAFTKALPRPRLQKLCALMSLGSARGGVL